jgi:hypothetical protein
MTYAFRPSYPFQAYEKALFNALRSGKLVCIVWELIGE